jgi:phosphopantothenate synthetase
VVEYELAGGSRQEVIAQARGAVVSVLIGEDETTTARAARGIAVRLAALPAHAIGG